MCAAISHAVEKYVADADLELFMLCLAGAVPDAAYHDQMNMLSTLKVRPQCSWPFMRAAFTCNLCAQRLMERLEAAYGKKRFVAFGKSRLPVGPGTGCVRRVCSVGLRRVQCCRCFVLIVSCSFLVRCVGVCVRHCVVYQVDLVATLRRFFPRKSKSDQRDMMEALERDPSMRKGDRVYYSQLFAETEEGDQEDFAEAVRDQHLEEIQACTVACLSPHRRHCWQRGAVLRTSVWCCRLR